MKKAFLFSFSLIFLLSISVLAQSETSAISTQDEEAAITNAKVLKVSEIRKVVVVRDLNQLKALPNSKQMKAQSKAQQLNAQQQVEKVQYDSKGGIIVPNASKGIKITPQNSSKVAEIKKSQKKKAERLNQSPRNLQKYRKDLSKRNVAKKSQTNTRNQKDN